ncbi:Hsp70 family protein [Actinokineospora sp.]|uniref:Hsp70 family protein n=1 Tax=Actinokineospora sp. TaxID=1872133 RepID=UPI004037E571
MLFTERSGGLRSMVTVAIDFGTSHSVAVVSWPGRDGELVTVDGAPWQPSAVFAERDGRLITGRDALRLGAAEPARLEPNPKARIDDGEILLGDTVVPVAAAVRAVLAELVAHACRAAPGTVQHLVLTHPADWGANRLGTLLAAARGLAPRVSAVPEPVAAAAWFSRHDALADGQSVAVLDFGGGTCDTAVVRRDPGGLTVLACAGLPDLGGRDLDQLLVEHAERTVPGLAERLGAGTVELIRFHEDVRNAKELLSRHPQAEIALPHGLPDLLITREEFTGLVSADIIRAVGLLDDTVRRSGRRLADLAAVQLVGGSSRVPLIGHLLAGMAPGKARLDDQPEAVVALGASTLLSQRQPAPASPVLSPQQPSQPAPTAPSQGQPNQPAPPVLSHRQPDQLAPAAPSPTRDRGPLLALAAAAVLLVATVGTGFAIDARSAPGTASADPAAEALRLPPPPRGEEIATAGTSTDGLTRAAIGAPVELVLGGKKVTWTVNSFTDNADDRFRGLGNNIVADTLRWVLVDTTITLADGGEAPYFTNNVFLVDDRGLMIGWASDATLPADCPLQQPALAQPGSTLRQCFGFLIRKTVPIAAVALASTHPVRPNEPQAGALVPVTGARTTGDARPVGQVYPLGTPRALTVRGTEVRVAPVDLVGTPSAYFDAAPMRLGGSKGLLLRVAVRTMGPVRLRDVAEAVGLGDDRGQSVRWYLMVAGHGCVTETIGGASATIDGEATLCLFAVVPTGTVLRYATVFDQKTERPVVWRLP